MYLSAIEIDTSIPAGRKWLSDPYRVHSQLYRAFADPKGERVLFRIEDQREQPRVIVQSRGEPNWSAAFAGERFVRRQQQKEVRLAIHAGQRLRFLLRANPTIRRKHDRKDPTNKEKDSRRYGLLREDEQRAWLLRKGEAGGFRPLAFEVRSAGQIDFARGRGEGAGRQTHVSVDFEGVLEVTDAAAFLAAIEAGIGPAKGFGFGLVSVAPE